MINVSQSAVNMMAAKIEVAMRKSEAMTWARLDLPPPPVASPARDHEKKGDDEGDSDSSDEENE